MSFSLSWLRLMLPLAMAVCVFLVVSACIVGCRSPDPRLLTPLDYIAVGVQGVDRYIADLPADEALRVRHCIRTAAAAVVVVEFRWDGDAQDSFQSANSTGIDLGAGRGILTAGHVVQNHRPDSQLRVMRQTSGQFEAALGDSVFDGADDAADWGFIRLEQDGRGEPIAVDEPVLGELVVVVGYPMSFGLSEDMAIVLTDSYSRSASLPGPVAVVARVSVVRPLTLDLVAGSMPLPGMSGSPIFNLRAGCVGILSGVVVTHGSGSSTTRQIRGTGVDLIPDDLLESKGQRQR
jgi:hypothetical protein